MRNIIFLIINILILHLITFSQPTIQWQKCLGGSESELANSVVQTNDGGYIVAGYSGSSDGNVTINNGLFDYWIVKMDSVGSIQWQKSYGGSEIEFAHSVLQINDGSYIVAGYSYSMNGDVSNNHGVFTTDYWIVKLDINGNLEWEESYGGSMFELAHQIIETNDGGFLVAGVSNSNNGMVTNNYGSMDIWIIKIDVNGNLIWQKTYGGSNNDGAYSVKQTNDNGFIIAGYTESQDHDVSNIYGASDYWIVKTDSLGNLQWEKNFGGSMTDIATSIEVTPDNGYVIAGHTLSNDFDVTNNNGFKDFWVVKIDSVGNLLWQKTMGGTDVDEAQSISLTSDSGYVVIGRTRSNNGDIAFNYGDFDFWILKLDVNGNIYGQMTLGGSGSDYAYSGKQTYDGGYIITGQTNSTNGDVTGNNGGVNLWIVKLNFIVAINDISTKAEFKLFPNPAQNYLNIISDTEVIENLKIYNSIGKVIYEDIIKKKEETIDISGLAQGFYFIKINNYCLKFVKTE